MLSLVLSKLFSLNLKRREENERIATPLKGLPTGGVDEQWEPFWEPQGV